MEPIEKDPLSLSKSRNSEPGGFLLNSLPGFFYVTLRRIRLPDAKAQRQFVVQLSVCQVEVPAVI